MLSHTCQKCRGLMVQEWIVDALEDAYAWKCINCGAMTDPTIEKNQQPSFCTTPSPHSSSAD